MTDNQDMDIDTALHEKEGSLRRGWPALLFTVGMVAAATYAFSPRHYPPFAPTRIHADDMIVNSLAHQGSRYVAVGELGHILITDDPGGRWHEATVDKHRSATLTRVEFVADDVAVAVGHSGWIVRSTDGGKTWHEVRFDEQSSDPLLGIAGPFDGKLYAYGSFGQFMVSNDLGKTWQSRDLNLAKPGEENAKSKGKASSANNPDSEDYDPFAAFAAGGGVQAMAKRHYNAMTRAADGSLFLAGERGLLARSTDGGKTWTELEQIYDGSFYGLMSLPGGRVLVYGMRGHAYYTDDHGRSWQRSAIGTDKSLFGGARAADGRIVLVGDSNEMLVSGDRGASFTEVSEHGPYGLVSIMPLKNGDWLTAGVGGVAVKQPPDQAATGKGAQS